jgi:MFS family permease
MPEVSADARNISQPAVPADQLARVRWSLVAQFGMFGIIITSWMGRLPSVREALDVTTGQLGGLMVVAAVGSLIGITVIGHAIMHYGSRATLQVSMLGAAIGFALLAMSVLMGSIPLFIIASLILGLSGPATNVPINLEAARVERMLGKAILPHVHAAFSVGALLGSGAAAITGDVGRA